jgi:hypothetical protein
VQFAATWAQDLIDLLGPGGAVTLTCLGWLLALLLRRRAERLADGWVDEVATALRTENDAIRREIAHAWDLIAVLKHQLVRARTASPEPAPAEELDEQALEYLDEGVQAWGSRVRVQWIDGRPHDPYGVPLQTTAVAKVGRRSGADPTARMLSAMELPPDDDVPQAAPPATGRRVLVSTAGVASR